MDAAEYIKDHENSFDVMIVDSSDPVGPAESLYTPEFYQCAHTCLKDDGIICTQGECMWLHLDMIQQVMESAKKIFRVVDYAYTSVPTYPCGQIGFIVASKSGKHNLCAFVYFFCPPYSYESAKNTLQMVIYANQEALQKRRCMKN